MEGECVGLASIDEVALCLRFMDLLRQDLPAVGEGMAEASCCPLRLVGTVAPTPLPFIPPVTGMALTASELGKRNREQDVTKGPFYSLISTLIDFIQRVSIQRHLE